MKYKNQENDGITSNFLFNKKIIFYYIRISTSMNAKYQYDY